MSYSIFKRAMSRHGRKKRTNYRGDKKLMDKIKIEYKLLICKHPERGGQTKNNKKIIKELQH